MPYLDLPTARLFYSDDGAGDPPLVLVHAWTGESSDWIWQIPAFAASHRVVALDLRGHGHSEAPAAGYALPQLAEDVAAVVARLGLARPVIIGHSLGGAIGCWLAAERPSLLRAVVSVDGGYRMGEEWRPRVAALLDGLKGMEAHRLVRESFGPRWHTDASPAHLRTWHLRRIDAAPRHALHGAFAGLADAMLFRSLAAPVLARIALPVLAFRTTAEEAAWERAQLRHPASRVELFEGAGHWLQQEQPEAFNAAVLGWLRDLAGQG